MIPGDFPGGVTFLCRSDGVGIVKSQYPSVVPVMKTQGIPDAVWNVRFWFHPPRLKLGPIAVFHGKDFTVQIQQSGKGLIFLGAVSIFHGFLDYHQMIVIARSFLSRLRHE
jgi:hypothetical protein